MRSRRRIFLVAVGAFFVLATAQSLREDALAASVSPQKRPVRQKVLKPQVKTEGITVRRRVLDQADILLPEQERDLEGKIRRFEMETQKHVAVLVAQQFNKEEVRELYARLASRNRIAPEEMANSVMIMIFVQQKLGRIEVGKNLQETIPPPLRRDIVQQRIMRRLKQGQFYGGVNAGLLGIMYAIKPDFKPYARLQTQGTRLANPKLLDEAGETNPPTIAISQPALMRGMKLSSKEKTVLVKGQATDPSGVFEVSINGVEANLMPTGEFSAQIRLAVGDNTVTVKAVDTKNNIAEQSFTVTREAIEAAPTAEETKSKETDLDPGLGKYYALVVGIDKYSGVWPALANASHDAGGVADILKSEYKFTKVTTLFDQDATRANIIKQLEWLTENVKKNDNVLIFYSGHGDYKKNLNKGFWVPVDAKSQSTVDYISNSDIQTFLNGIPSKHTLLIADACFSGDIFRGMEETVKNDDMQRYYDEVERRASRQAMSSGGLEPVMDGGRDGHSVFTYYLLKTLKENDAPYLDAGKLYDQIKIPVANNSDQTPVFNAIKNTGDEGGQFVFRKK